MGALWLAGGLALLEAVVAAQQNSWLCMQSSIVLLRVAPERAIH